MADNPSNEDIEPADFSVFHEEECQRGDHEFGDMELARFTGNPHRRCKFCGFVTLDLDEDEGEEK